MSGRKRIAGRQLNIIEIGKSLFDDKQLDSLKLTVHFAALKFLYFSVLILVDA